MPPVWCVLGRPRIHVTLRFIHHPASCLVVPMFPDIGLDPIQSMEALHVPPAAAASRSAVVSAGESLERAALSKPTGAPRPSQQRQ